MKNILVVGAGSIGERHIRCFRKTGRAVVAVCEINDVLRERVVTDYALPSQFRSLDEAMAQSFDAAVICTPAHLHIPMSLQLAKQGVGLLIEKPLSTSTDGIEELQAVIAQQNLPAGVAYVMRNHPAMAALKQALDSDRFGRPVQVVYAGGQHFPFYRPAYRDTYYAKHETGGGAIQDAITHIMNASEWLVGPVSKLVADAEHCVLDGVDVEDTVNVITRHGDIPGSFSLNQHQPPNENQLTVICERGTIRGDFTRHRWLSCVEPGAPWYVEEEFSLERDDMFINQANAFLDVLDGTAEATCTLAEALQTLRVNLATLQSVRAAEWVTL